MSHRYLTALTTPAVEAAQEQFGSRASMRRLVAGWHTDGVLGEDEVEFVHTRDSFYLGTVGGDGWPYVQHRGGPPGFLRLLEQTEEASLLGWADYWGNRQYLSVGNLGSSDKVSLFLMDYAQQRRLKILGTARSLDVRDGGEAAALAEQLTDPAYPARVERVVTVRVHAYDWNCPQHITPRWSQAELAPVLQRRQARLDAELAVLREENRRLRQHIQAVDGS